MAREQAESHEKFDLGDEDFRRFRDLIAGRFGIYFDPSQKDSLRISLLTRMAACGLTSFSDYYQLLYASEGLGEFEQLLDLITINETHFFRDQAQFMAVRRYVIPEILAHKSGEARRLRIWSAGCSTGEEPYTVAMILAAEGRRALPSVEILATDVSMNALEAARRGIYRERALRNTPLEYRQRYFRKEDGLYILDESIKQMVEFRYFNLVSEPYPLSEMSGWDIIFCRNVTIYFQPESTKRVIHNFYRSLTEGGYLFTGFSECLRYISREFSLVQMGGVFIYKKKRAEETEVQKRLRPARRRAPRPDTSLPYPPRARKNAAASGAAEGLAWTRAREYVKDGRPEDAREVLGAVLEKSGPSVEVLLLQAELAVNQGDAAQALEICQRIVRSDSLSVAGQFLSGIIYRTMEQEEKAVGAFKRVIYLKPDHALARFYLGELYGQSGDVEAARREFGNAMHLLQENPQSLDHRFAGGFSPRLLIDTCRSRLEALRAPRQAERASRRPARGQRTVRAGR